MREFGALGAGPFSGYPLTLAHRRWWWFAVGVCDSFIRQRQLEQRLFLAIVSGRLVALLIRIRLRSRCLLQWKSPDFLLGAGISFACDSESRQRVRLRCHSALSPWPQMKPHTRIVAQITCRLRIESLSQTLGAAEILNLSKSTENNSQGILLLALPFCWTKFPKNVAKFKTKFPKFSLKFAPRFVPKFAPKFFVLSWQVEKSSRQISPDLSHQKFLKLQIKFQIKFHKHTSAGLAALTFVMLCCRTAMFCGLWRCERVWRGIEAGNPKSFLRVEFPEILEFDPFYTFPNHGLSTQPNKISKQLKAHRPPTGSGPTTVSESTELREVFGPHWVLRRVFNEFLSAIHVVASKLGAELRETLLRDSSLETDAASHSDC